jgi:hypothetical protein
LFWFSIANGRVALLPGSARRRNGSPCSGSILMTSAPPFASRKVAYGPWKICPKSITTSPASGSRPDADHMLVMLPSRSAAAMPIVPSGASPAQPAGCRKSYRASACG